MHSLNSLVWRNLTAHLLRSILTALAIALGVGMVLAATIVGQAASRSATELSDEGPRIDLDVSARDGGTFDQAILDRLRASPDVERASPSLRVEVKGVEPDISGLTLLGVEPHSYVALFEPELANGTFSYQFEEGKLTRRNLSLDPENDGGDATVWSLPNSVVQWRIWRKGEKGYAVEVNAYMRHKLRTRYQKKMANSHVYFLRII